jgi:hypothetical protein
MKGKFTRYFATIEYSTLFSYTIFLLISVAIVASGVSRLIHSSKRASGGTLVSALTHARYTPNHLYRSNDKNYLIQEDDKPTTRKFVELSDPALITSFKAIRFSAIGTNIDNSVYSINRLPYVSALGFNPLRSPPYFC